MIDPTTGTDDAEVADLTEAWSAFGQLLANAPPTLDEDKLVRQINDRIARHRTKRRAYAALALAASVVLAVGFSWWPSGVVEKQLARAPQPLSSAKASADFGWHDDLSDEIESAARSLEVVQSEARGDFDRARWVQQEMDELAWDLELSSL